jgi:hypothetical protein
MAERDTDLQTLAAQALERWGPEEQRRQAAEECQELAIALRHLERGKIGWVEVAREMADVEITQAQLRLMVPEGLLEAARVEKLAKLRGLLNGEPRCPNLDRARELAAEWARGLDQWPAPAPHPELLVWARAFMADNWGGERIGSVLSAGISMALKMGGVLRILGKTIPAGAFGTILLCEAAGWPRHPEPGEDPLPPLR